MVVLESPTAMEHDGNDDGRVKIGDGDGNRRVKDGDVNKCT
jgi:hypothetical protein